MAKKEKRSGVGQLGGCDGDGAVVVPPPVMVVVVTSSPTGRDGARVKWTRRGGSEIAAHARIRLDESDEIRDPRRTTA